MPVPASPSKVLGSWRQTLISCATLRRILGAADEAAASESVYDRFTNDQFPEGTNEADPDKQPLDPYPRVVLVDGMPQTTKIYGSMSIMGSGHLQAFLEFKQLSAAELSDWYGESITDPTDRDHWIHADNLKTALRNEIIEVAQAAGCLTITSLVEEIVGLIDPATNNGLSIWVICFQVQWEGLP